MEKKNKGPHKFTTVYLNREKAAFSGNGLGAQYGLPALQERTAQHQRMETEEIQRQHIRLRL